MPEKPANLKTKAACSSETSIRLHALTSQKATTLTPISWEFRFLIPLTSHFVCNCWSLSISGQFNLVQQIGQAAVYFKHCPMCLWSEHWQELYECRGYIVGVEVQLHSLQISALDSYNLSPGQFTRWTETLDRRLGGTRGRSGRFG